VTASIKVKGLREVERMMLELKGPKATRALRSSMLKACEPIVQQAKDNAPAASGALRQAIARWFVVDGRGSFLGFELPSLGGRFRVHIGPRLKDKPAIALYNLAHRRRRSGIYHGHFLERGTSTRPARKFLEPALTSRASEAIAILEKSLRAALARIARRSKR
jgi:HK97 gp10 family phage protein